MQQRLYYLDNVCGFMIIQVILGHLVGMCSYHNAAFDLIYKTLSFFMFWFFFKGGMMYRDRDVKEELIVSAKRLLVPYLFIMLIGLVIEAYIETLCHSIVISDFLSYKFWYIANNSALDSVSPCWFLLSLFMVRIVFQICTRHNIAPGIIAAVSFIVAYLIYIFSYKHDSSLFFQLGYSNSWNLHVPFYFGNMSLGLMCYSLGNILKEKQFSKVILLCSAVLFIVKYIIWADFDFRTNNSLEYNYFLSVLYGVSGCIVINYLFKRIADLKIPVLTSVGKNSMIYYLVHYPVMFLITQRFYGTVFNLSSEIRFVLLSCVLVIVLWGAGMACRKKKISFLFGI